MRCDILVIGGGAAGMCAAITAKRISGASVILTERGERVGRKLAATGNGRCNITNRDITAERYHGGDVEPVLANVTPDDTQRFFESLGIVYFCGDDGKVYPYSLQASSVVDALRYECERLGVEVMCECEVTEINRHTAITASGRIEFKRAIIACGGEASRSLGGSSLGYKLLGGVGHSVTRRGAAIVPIRTKTDKIRALKGIKTDAVVTAESQFGRRTEEGEVLFTDYGLSGPPILQVSRLFDGVGGTVTLDLMPQYSFSEVCDMIRARKSSVYLDRCEFLFVGMLNKRVGQAVVKAAGISLADSARALDERRIKLIAAAIKSFSLVCTGNCGTEHAQVTTGGVPLSEFDTATMRSTVAPSIYACGEVLDVDGDCGGFNLQWAWSSGILAGRSAAMELKK